MSIQTIDIDGVEYVLLPTEGPYYATCPTAAETSVKVATVDDTEHFSLKAGVMVTVNFMFGNGNSGRSQLNVNGTGAKDMRLHEPWEAGDCVTFVYDGTRWVATTGSSVRYTAGDGVAIDASNVVSVVVDRVNGNGLSVGRDGLALSKATTSSAGAMSANDKAKLDGVEDGAQANVQSDWAQADSSADDFIKNKPTIPIVGHHASGDILLRSFPSALYTRLKGVMNVASQTYLNTGMTAKNDDLELDLRFTVKTKPSVIYNTILGSMSGSYALRYLGICTWGSKREILLGVRDTDGYINSGIALVAGHTYTVQATMLNGVATLRVVDETANTTFSGTSEYTLDGTSVIIYLLYRSYSGGSISTGEFEYHMAVMRKGGETVFDYIPAQRISDSAVGFYDTVSGELVTATAGEFVAGSVTENVNDIIVEVPDIPHNTSDLNNDSGFITEADIPTVPEYTVEKMATAEAGYASSYVLKKDGTQVGATINIPKDMVVSGGEVKTVTTANQPYTGAQVGDKYIDLTIANASQSHIYVPVKDLVDAYTAGTGISISSSNVISLSIPVAIANGGTGGTTAEAAEYNLTPKLATVLNTDFVDGAQIPCVLANSASTANGRFYGVRTALKMWNYIKSKISSILGIGESNGVPTAPTAASGTNTTQIATTAFVNSATSGLANDSNVVHKAGTETVTGAKTFTSSVMIKDAQLRFETAGSVNRTIVMNASGTTTGGFAVLEMTDEDETDNLVLRGISNPVDRNDAANKAYVDDIVGDIETLLNAI